jgi:hypothetical protein
MSMRRLCAAGCLVASGLDDLVGQAVWVGEDKFMTTGRLYQTVPPDPARQPRSTVAA